MSTKEYRISGLRCINISTVVLAKIRWMYVYIHLPGVVVIVYLHWLG